MSRLADRAAGLLIAMVKNPSAAARGHVDAARALATVITAMKRIAQNRMEGDGAEAGRKLLRRVDQIIEPVRSDLG